SAPAAPSLEGNVKVRRLSVGEAHAAISWVYRLDVRERDFAAQMANVREELERAAAADPEGALVKELLAWRRDLERLAAWRKRAVAAEKAPAVCSEDVATDAPLSPGAWSPRSLLKSLSEQPLRDLDGGANSVSTVTGLDLAAGDVLVASGSPGRVP